MLKHIFALIVFQIAFIAFSYGQDTTQFKRVPYKLTVAVDKESFYEEDLKGGTFIYPDNTIQLYPGEMLFVEIEQTGGVIKKMTPVKEIKDPAKTLTLHFMQITEGKVHQQMMLKVVNPFKYKLSYKANIYLFKSKRWADTDVYPVEPELSAFETWPDIIITIGLGGWAFVK